MKTTLQAVLYAFVILVVAVSVNLEAAEVASASTASTAPPTSTTPVSTASNESNQRNEDGPKSDSVTDLCPVWPGCIIF